VNRDVKKYTLKNIGTSNIVEIPQVAHEKRNRVKAIEEPLPGLSYNPDGKEYGKLVDELVQKEENLIKKDEHLDRVLAPLYQPISKGEKKRRIREEMTMGFPIEGEQSSDSDDNDEEYKALNPPVRNKKKDTKARRKQKELKVKQARLEREKHELKKIKDLAT
jgi:nucleolar protein 53